MNSATRSPFAATPVTPADASADINAYRWLLVLGFPPPVAAASTMPELFTVEEPHRARR